MSLPNAFIYFVRGLMRNAAKFMHAITQLLHCVHKMLKYRVQAFSFFLLVFLSAKRCSFKGRMAERKACKLLAHAYCTYYIYKMRILSGTGFLLQNAVR